MNLRFARATTLAVVTGVVLAGCSEQLTAPGSCPATCPGGDPVLRDTVLDAIVDHDSLYSGYLTRGAALAGMRVANGLTGHTDYGIVGFVSRPDTVPTRDTADPYATYTIDSVAITVTLLARDTTASGIRLALHRLPASTDTSVTFAEVDPLIVPGTLIDSVTIADSVRPSFTYRFVFRGDTLALVDIPPADSGVLAMAVAISGGTATGARFGGIGSGSGVPLMFAYVNVNTTDTTASIKHQVVQSRPRFTTFVSSVPTPAYDPTILSVGTATGVRAYIHFPWPAYLRDSALLARATLELVPEVPFTGLSGDSAFIDVRGVRVDFGPKSPLAGLAGTEPMPFGSADTLRIDVVSEIVNWQLDRLAHPPLLVVIVSPEGASFTEPRFYSTRSPVAARRPRLRITYQLPFEFERP